MSDIYKNREEHNSRKERGILIVFDDMIADMLSNKNCNLKLNLNISLAFIMQSYFAVLKKILD